MIALFKDYFFKYFSYVAQNGRVIMNKLKMPPKHLPGINEEYDNKSQKSKFRGSGSNLGPPEES
jgi:hypothetical protein